MTWFRGLTGFEEESPDQVRDNIDLVEGILTSRVNGRVMDPGEFSKPRLDRLRSRVSLPPKTAASGFTMRELVADVKSLHHDSANANAVFQVASQFNCLEMAAPHLRPEDGVGIYEDDWTQGPACAICAGAGTIFRNYFAEVNGETGQSSANQIDCLADVESELRDSDERLWKMQNGYCFPDRTSLKKIETTLAAFNQHEFDLLRAKLRIGVQWQTEVTIGDSGNRVTQVFCSALPVSYSGIPARHWNLFPRLVLDATYEATFYVALENLIATGCKKLYLTLVGGGVFGNRLEWILSAIERAAELFAGSDLDVYIVSYGQSNPEILEFLDGRFPCA